MCVCVFMLVCVCACVCVWTFRLPFLQYCITRQVLGGSMQTPKNWTRFSCFISFICSWNKIQLLRQTTSHQYRPVQTALFKPLVVFSPVV